MKTKKKLLILAMSCEQEFFKKAENCLITKSYAKPILDKMYDDVDFYTYSASQDNKIHINKNNHRIQVPVDDSLYGTYEKTRLVLKVLDALNIEYDYIFRTNCSTWVNVELLKEFVDEIPAEDYMKIFGGMIKASYGGSAPDDYDLFGCGNSLLLSKFWCDVIKDTPITEDIKKLDRSSNVYDTKSVYYIDDNAIGFVVNLYAEQHNIDKYSLWHQLVHYPIGILNVPEMTKEIKDNIYYICRIYNPNYDRTKEFEVLEHFENHKYKEYDFKNYTDEIYRYFSKRDKISLTDFPKSLGVDLDYDVAMSFIKNIEKYDKSLEKFLVETKTIS